MAAASCEPRNFGSLIRCERLSTVYCEAGSLSLGEMAYISLRDKEQSVCSHISLKDQYTPN